MKDFFKGVRYFMDSGSFVIKHRLTAYYLIPLVVSILLYFLLFGLLVFNIFRLVSSIAGLSEMNISEDMSWWLLFKTALSGGLLSLFVFLISLGLGFKFSKYIVLILLSPLFAFLSERTEEIMTGKTYPFDLYQFLKDIIRGIVMAMRNMCIELFWTILIALLGLFSGGMGIVATPILVIIGAYFYGFSFIDYVLERRKLGIQESVRVIKEKKSFAIGIGMMYWLTDRIPVIGLSISTVHSVVGSCRYWIETEEARQM